MASTAQRQVVLIACAEESNITAWDLHTATQLTSYKGNASPRNGLVCLGRDYLVAAHSAKDALQFWGWHKDHALQRSFTVERTTALAASPGGAYLAAGGASGAVYVWETATGRLLRSWPAHYKAVSALAFVDGGGLLVSCGEDTLVNVWPLAQLLDASGPDAQAGGAGAASLTRPQPLYSWSEHTLAVTGVHVGLGEATALVATCSLDHTVKVHRLADGALLRSFTLPASLHAVVVDAGEHVMFVGGGDGSVFELPLVGGGGGGGGSGDASAAGAADSDAAFGDGGMTGRALAAGAGASASASSAAAAGVRQPYVRLEGHARAVTCLALSADGEYVASGSDDGTVRVWELRSRQQVQLLQSHNKQPVSAILVVNPPPHLTASGSGGAAHGGRQGAKRPLPLAPLAKFVGAGGSLKPWEGAPVVLDGSTPALGITQRSGLWAAALGLQDSVDGGGGGGLHASAAGFASNSSSAAAAQEAAGVRPAGDAVGGEPGASGGSVEDEVARLRGQLAAAQQAAAQWQALHGQLYKFCVEQLVDPTAAAAAAAASLGPGLRQPPS